MPNPVRPNRSIIVTKTRLEFVAHAPHPRSPDSEQYGASVGLVLGPLAQLEARLAVRRVALNCGGDRYR